MRNFPWSYDLDGQLLQFFKLTVEPLVLIKSLFIDN